MFNIPGFYWMCVSADSKNVIAIPGKKIMLIRQYTTRFNGNRPECFFAIETDKVAIMPAM